MRRRFVAAALFGLAGCHPAPKPDAKPSAALTAPATPPPTTQAPQALQPDASLTPAQIAARATPSVALIKLPALGRLGSGFVIAPDGRIATNLHVIRGAREAVVILSDGREFKDPEVLAADEEHDLAVIRIPLSGVPALPLGDSGAVHPGDRVVAIGNPLGFGNTVSDGLLSAVRVVDKNLTVLQISAPISPGSSGGPLLDDRGRVIGVSTLMSTRGQNLNFGVPVAYLKPLLSSVKAVPIGEWGAGGARHGAPHHEVTLLDGCSQDQMALIVETLAHAISVGAPLFDDGNPEACYRVYEGAVLGLDPSLAGCGGARRALSDGMRRAGDATGWEDKAWALRDAFDGLVDVIRRKTGAPEAPDTDDAPPVKVRKRTIPVHPLAYLKGCSESDLKTALSGIAQAISVGAPLYNDGNHEACYRIYEAAALELEHKVGRCGGVVHALRDGRKRAGSLERDDDKAWAMRDAFDGLIDVIERRLDR